MLTTTEVSQYIRLTLKEKGFSHLTVTWHSATTRSFIGLAEIRKNNICLNEKILRSFAAFREVLLHEIAHFEQYRRNGNKFLRKNGRWQLHGADFKAVCQEYKIPARTKIPV